MQTEKEYIAGREMPGIRSESVGEYSLPDYNGDVKKVLFVRPKLFPSGKFVADGVLELSGIVEYEVVYLDSDNILTRAQFSTDYDAALKVNADTYVDSDVVTQVSSYSVRLSGPRKFSVKAVLDTAVSISEKRTLSVDGDAFMEYEPEYVGDSVRVLNMEFAVADAREIEEEMVSLDGAIADEVQILLCDAYASASVHETSALGVNVKGDVTVDMLYVGGDGEVKRVRKEIPYSEDVALSEASDFANVTARVEITGLKSNVIPTDDGVKVCAAVTVASCVCARKNGIVNLVSDAFLKERGTENEYGDYSYTEYVCAQIKEDRQQLDITFADLDIDGVSDILYSSATARVDRCDDAIDTAEVSGEIRFCAIGVYVNDDGTRVFMPIKFSTPFRQNVNLDCQISANKHLNCIVDVKDVVMTVDANRVEAAYTVCTSVSAFEDKKTRRLVSSYVTDEEYSHDGSVVTVYYPDTAENLFDIARKFHTSTRSIAESNRLSESVFVSSTTALGTFGVGKLIIK